MLSFFAVQVLLEFEFHLGDVDARIKYVRLVGVENVVEFLKSAVAGEGLGLHFVLVGLLIEGEPVSGDGSVDCGPEVSVLFDDIALAALDLNVFTRLVHLAEYLDTLALNFSEGALLVLRFLEPDLLRPLSVLLLNLLFSFDQSRLKQVQAFVLETLDVVFAFVPLTELLLLHKTAAQGEAGLVRRGRQGVFKSALLSHLFNELHLSHAGGQAGAELEVGDREGLGHVVLVEHVGRTEGVSLCARLTEHRLHLHSLRLGLRLRLLGRLDALSGDLHDTLATVTDCKLTSLEALSAARG